MPARQVLHYEILEKIGEGGMGVVYKARDTRLDRPVALKFLPATVRSDDLEGLRFLNEARAASGLEHPNVCAIHDIEKTDDGQVFIVMPCYEGETLQARMQHGRLPVAEAIDIARQAAAGLGRAHARGIVHRDVKPSNIFLTHDGIVKVLDFGVAKLLNETGVTRTGTTIGTVGYMSPEQVRGESADPSADVWAIGVLLYEMLTGRPAFPGDRAATVLNAILTAEPRSLAGERPETPPALAAIAERALRKDRTARYGDATEMAAALGEAADAMRAAAIPAPAGTFKRPAVAIAVALVAIAAITALAWVAYRSSRARWARNEGLPQIAKLAAEGNYIEAAALATQAEPYLPNDPVLQRLWTEISAAVTIESTPEGAEVRMRPYRMPDAPERVLGVTPIRGARVPLGAYRWRFSKAGYEPIERAAEAREGVIRIDLPAAGSIPDGMVMVPKGAEVMMVAAFGLPSEIALDDYFIQRHEVTNRDFKKFVDAGGYRRPELWKHPFVRDGRELPREEAMTLFVDQAGQPGPATWEVGRYPAGRDDSPVGGISWFEAAAYAEFAGLSLPTVHHWYRAAGVDASSYILPLANFDREGTLPVGRSGAMSPFGAFDMAGNVREWTWNESGDGRRYTVGGGSGEPPYMFGDPEPRSPFDRSPTTGVRCVKYSAAGPGERSLAPLVRHTRDYRAAKPAPDDTFNLYVRMQQYDPVPLDARVERTTESPEGWRVERVSFTAAYPNDRVVAYLWIPRHVKPPYQTVLFFPGAESLIKSGSEQLEQPGRLDFLVRSGRAVVHPVYFGMYERFRPRSRGDIERRDTSLRWSQDVRRTLDYLATRPDLDHGRLAYFGTSLGASFGPVPLAVDDRFTLALLVGGGFTSASVQEEVSAVNYVSRVKVPTLLLCGRHDFFFPYETSQKPFFDLLGTPAEHKRHVTVEAGHSVPRHEYFREVLGWLDRYFGPAR